MPKGKRFLKTVSIIVALLFSVQDISWALATLKTAKIVQDELLAPPLMLHQDARAGIAKSATMLLLNSMGAEAFARTSHFYPSVAGKKIHIFPGEIGHDGRMQVVVEIEEERFDLSLNVSESSFGITDLKRSFSAEHRSVSSDNKLEQPGDIDTEEDSDLAPETIDDIGEDIRKLTNEISEKGLTFSAGERIHNGSAERLAVFALEQPSIRGAALSTLELILGAQAAYSYGASSNPYLKSVQAVSGIARSDPEIIRRSTVEALKRSVIQQKQDHLLASASIEALDLIGRNASSDISAKAVTALLEILTTRGLSKEAYSQASAALVSIAKAREEERLNLFLGLQKILTTQILEIRTYRGAMDCLEKLARIDPVLGGQIIVFMESLLCDDILNPEVAPDCVKVLGNIVEVNPAIISRSTIEAINKFATEEKYVKGTIAQFYIEYAGMIEKTARKRPELLTASAVLSLKRGMDTSNLAERAYLACSQALGQIAQSDSFVKEEAFQLLEDVLQKPAPQLPMPRYEAKISASGNVIGEIAASSSSRSERALSFLERTIKEKNLSESALSACVVAWGDIAEKNPGFISETTLASLESLLDPDDHGKQVITKSARTVGEIAQFAPQLIKSSTVKALDKLQRKSSMDVSFDPHAAAAQTLRLIAQNRPDLREEAVSSLENILLEDGFSFTAVSASAGAIENFIKARPDLATESIITTMSKVLFSREKGLEIKIKSARALASAADQSPDLFVRVLNMYYRLSEEGEKVLSKNLIESLADEISVEVISEIDFGEDWHLVLGTVDPATGARLRREELIEILFEPDQNKRTLKAIQQKREVYRRETGRSFSSVGVDEEKLPFYLGTYKLPWKEFVSFMNRHYEAFHNDPETFIRDISDMELSGDTDFFPETEDADMATEERTTTNSIIRRHIQNGSAFEVSEIKEQIRRITFDQKNPGDENLEEEYAQSGLFAKIRRAKKSDSLKRLLDERDNFRNLDEEQKEELIRIARETGVSLIEGRGTIGRTGDGSVKLAHARTGYSSASLGLKPAVWMGELLLKDVPVEDLSILLLEEAQHILKPPAFVDGVEINKHGRIQEASDPGTVIEHDEQFLNYIIERGEKLDPEDRKSEVTDLSVTQEGLEQALEKKNWGDVLTIAEKLITKKEFSSSEVKDLVENLVYSSQDFLATSVALFAIKRGVKKMTFLKISEWGSIIGKLYPDGENAVIEGQRELLKNQLLRNKEMTSNLFAFLNSRFAGLSCGLGYESFRQDSINILEGKATSGAMSKKHETFLRNYFKRLFGHKVRVSEDESLLIRLLSMEITRAIRDARQASPRRLKGVGELSFREGVRFKQVFSRYYLKDMETAKSRVFEYFVLAAWAVYGRFIDVNDRKEFAQILIDMFNKEAYKDLFTESSVESGKEITVDEALKIFDYGRFESDEEKDEVRFPYERKILASVERAESSDMTAFLFMPSEYFPDAVVQTLSSKENSTVFPISMSGFTQRKEFFGRVMPDEDGNIGWYHGAIKRIAEYARENPSEKVYFVIENPDFAQGDVRMSLHQILLERKVTIEQIFDESGRKKSEISLPENMQIVLAMGKDNEVDDESFMDRASGCYFEEITETELEKYLEKKIGLPDEGASELAKNIFPGIKKDRRTREKISLQDIIMIGHFAAGRISEEGSFAGAKQIVREEAALHLLSKFSPREEQRSVELLKEVVGDLPKLDITFSEDGDSISFGGVVIDIDRASQFGSFVKKKIKQEKRVPEFNRVLEAFLPQGYFISGTELRTLCLLARVYKLSPEKVTFLQGLSGEGKTTTSKVFLDIIGHKKQEFTVNKETGISSFRGDLAFSPEGIKMRVPEYWKNLTENNIGTIINEADTRKRLLEWLWPEISGRAYRFGWEYPSTDSGDPMGQVLFGENKMMLFTGNVRDDLPAIIEKNIPATYCVERTPEEVRQIIEKIVLTRFLQVSEEKRGTLKEQSVLKAARVLSDVYIDLTLNVRDGTFNSKRQVTPRQIERFKELLFMAFEQGKDFDKVYKYLLNAIFVAMWDNEEDRRTAHGMVKSHVTDLSPPLSSKELMDFAADFPLDNVPVLILTDGTQDFATIRKKIMAKRDPSAEEIIEPISYFHSKKSLIGDFTSIPGESGPANKAGVLPRLILKSHLSGKEIVCWMPGYLNLNSEVAQFPNEFFQTGWLRVDELLEHSIIADTLRQVEEAGAYDRLRREFEGLTKEELPEHQRELTEVAREKFVSFLLGYKPDNLLIRAVGTAEETLMLHPADVDRFLTLNISEGMDGAWIEDRLLTRLPWIKGNEKKAVKKCLTEAFKVFEEMKEDGIYEHKRLGPEEVDVFLEEIKKRREENGAITEEEITLLAYHILGSGLVVIEESPKESIKERDYKRSYTKGIGLRPEIYEYSPALEERDDGIYFVIKVKRDGKNIDLAEMRTRYESRKKQDEYGRYLCRIEGEEHCKSIRLQAPLRGRLEQQASNLIFSAHGKPVVLEGDPGGGKTSGARDIAKATGRPYHEEGMHKSITLDAILGSYTIKGKDEVVLNTLDKDADGRYVLPFLRMYAEGGIFVADEGFVSKKAGQLLRWMTMVSQLDEIDLGSYHPGLEGIKVERHPGFSLVITQNYFFKTEGRSAFPWELDRQCGKIRVDNVLSEEDAIRLINYYFGEDDFDEDLKKKLARTHVLLSKAHPARRMISPRDLIDTVQIIKYLLKEKENISLLTAVYEGISVNYLAGITDPELREELGKNIVGVFPDFAMSDYSEHSFEDLGHSNVRASELTYLRNQPYYMKKAAVIDRMISATSDLSDELVPARQVLIEEKSGTDGMGLVKLYSHLSGRRLLVVEGSPFITSKILLGGENLEFETEFDDKGVRKAKLDNLVQKEGIIRRYLVKKEELQDVPEGAMVPTIIAISNAESIPTNELDKFNELIAMRSMLLEDENGRFAEYVLPPWVTIMPLTSDITSLAAPFANRYRKIGLTLSAEVEEIWPALSAEYPNLTELEAEFLFACARLATELCGQDGSVGSFELGYNFTPRKIEEMAFRVQKYKQEDHENGVLKDDPFWYALKALNYTLLIAMCPRDRALFTRKALVPVMKGYFEELHVTQLAKYLKSTLGSIRKESREKTEYAYWQTDPIAVSLFSGEVYELANGIQIHKSGDRLLIMTDANAYDLSYRSVKNSREGVVLSEGLSVLWEEGALVLRYRFINEIGGNRLADDIENLKRSLPPEEMKLGDFMFLADPLIDILKAFLEARTPVKTAQGRVIPSRISLMAGSTGSGKTTIPKMISKAEGTPLVRINPWKGMHGSKLTVSLSMGETVQLEASDFLIALGEIGDKRKQAAYETSNLSGILFDEANVTKNAWYILDAVARGEKDFRVETPAGDRVKVSIDEEKGIVMTYNPPERYGGTGKGSSRYVFPASFANKTMQIYTNEPVDDYSPQDMNAIMEAIFARGQLHFQRRELKKELAGKPVTREVEEAGFVKVPTRRFEVRKIDEGEKRELGGLQQEISSKFPPAPDFSEKREKEIKESLEKIQDRISFDAERLRTAVNSLKQNKDRLTFQEQFYAFARTILLPTCKGLAAREIDEELYKTILELTSGIEPKAVSMIQDLSEVYSSKTVYANSINKIMQRMQSLSAERDVYLENLEALVFSGRPVIDYMACPVEDRKSFTKDRLLAALGEDDFRKVFGDHFPDILVVKRPDDGTAGFYNGMDVVVSYMNNSFKEKETASHELGHYISDRLAKKGDREIDDRLKRNVELYSILFPMILLDDPEQYVLDTLLTFINRRSEDDDAYALAASALLNAFCTEYPKELEPVTKEFEEDKIRVIVNKISSLSSKEIRELAIKFWQNPRIYYANVEIGNYVKRRLSIKGSSGISQVFTYHYGPTVKPRVRTIDTKDLELPRSSPVEQKKSPPKDEEYAFVDDREQEELSVGTPRKLPEVPKYWEKVYEKLFAPEQDRDDVEPYFVSSGGEEINPEGLYPVPNPEELLIAFYDEGEETTLAQNVFFIIDASGSITRENSLQETIEEMVRYYSSFLLEISRKNPDLNIGIATITGRFDVLFDLAQWKEAKSHDRRRELLEKALEEIWFKGGGEGIDTPVLLDGLSKVEFPSSNKDVKNLVVVLTDGQETGRSEGADLKEMIRDFREGRYKTPYGAEQVQAAKKQKVDLAFVGAALTDGGEHLEKNYPAFFNAEAETTSEYLEVLYKLSYLQAKNKPLDGDLGSSMEEHAKRKYSPDQSIVKAYSLNPFALPLLFMLFREIGDHIIENPIISGTAFAGALFAFGLFYLSARVLKRTSGEGTENIKDLSNVRKGLERISVSAEQTSEDAIFAARVFEKACRDTREDKKVFSELEQSVTDEDLGWETLLDAVEAMGDIAIEIPEVVTESTLLTLEEKLKSGPAYGAETLILALGQMAIASELGKETVAIFERLLHTRGLGPGIYVAVINASGELAQPYSGPGPGSDEEQDTGNFASLRHVPRSGKHKEVKKEVFRVLTEALKTEGFEPMQYFLLADEVAKLINEKEPDLTEQAISSLKEILSTKGLDPAVYMEVAEAFTSRTTAASPRLMSLVFSAFVEILISEDIEKSSFYTSALQVSSILENYPSQADDLDPHTADLAVIAISEAMNMQVDGIESYSSFVSIPRTLKALGLYRPGLIIKPGVVSSLEKHLETDDMEEDVYMDCAGALSVIAENERSYIKRFIRLAEREIKRGKGFLREPFMESFSEEFPVDVFGDSIEDDWSLILATTDPSLGTTFEKDVFETFFLPNAEQEKSLKAIQIKQSVYCALSGKEPVAINEEKIASYLGRYKMPWEEFVKFMDEHYYEFHENPESFIIDPLEMDINDPFTALTDEEPDMATGEELKRAERTLSQEGFDAKTYFASAETLAGLVKDHSSLRQEAITVMRNVLSKDGLHTNVYTAVARSLGDIAKTHPEVIPESIISAVEKRLIAENVGWDAGGVGALVSALDKIALSFKLNKKATQALQRIMQTDGLDFLVYAMSARALVPFEGPFATFQDKVDDKKHLATSVTIKSLENAVEDMSCVNILYKIVPLRPDLVTSETVKVLEEALMLEYVDLYYRSAVANVLGEIAEVRPDLIKDRTVSALETAIRTDDLSRFSYFSYQEIAEALGKIAKKDPGNFVRVWRIAESLLSEKREDETEYIADSLPEEVPLESIRGIDGGDWTLVLKTITDPENAALRREDLKEILLSGSQSKRAEKAIKIKQAVYCRISGKDAIPIDPDKIFSYLGRYKLPWEEFVSFMRENYYEFHRSPVSCLVDIMDMDLPDPDGPVGPENTDMTGEDLGDIKRELLEYATLLIEGDMEKTLTANDIFGKITSIAEKYPKARSETLKTLESVLMTEGLDAFLYLSCSRAMGEVVRQDTRLLDNVIRIFEKALLTKEVEVVRFAGLAPGLANIAIENPDLAPKILGRFESILRNKDFTEGAHADCATAVGTVAKTRSSMIESSLLAALEDILKGEEVPSESTNEVIKAIGEIANKRPEMLKESTYSVVLKNLDPAFSRRSPIQNSIETLISIAENRLDLCGGEAVLKLKDVVEDEHTVHASYVHKISGQALGLLARKDQEAMKQILLIAREIIRAGKEDRAENILEALPENLFFEVPRIVDDENASLILETRSPENKGHLMKEDLKKMLSVESQTEAVTLAIEIKQRSYCRVSGEEAIPIRADKLSSYLGYYKLPWEDFAIFMREKYHEFHEDPEKFIEDPRDMELGDISFEDLENPEISDISDGKRVFPKSVLRDIAASEELAEAIKESMLSAAFSERIVIAFTSGVGQNQLGSPASTVRSALKSLKKVPEYEKLLSNLVIFDDAVDSEPEQLRKYADSENTSVFVFATFEEKDHDLLKALGRNASAVYIDPSGFHRRAYYPLAEVVVLALAEYHEGIIAEGEVKKSLETPGGKLDLEKVNIESITRVNGKLIFKLLPEAEAHEFGELERRYGNILRLLRSA